MWTQKKNVRSYISHHILIVSALLVAVLSVLSYSIFIISNKNIKKENVSSGDMVEVDKSITIEKPPKYNIEFLSSITTIAQSHVVYDPLEGQEIASKNSQKIYPLASITKVMTAYVAYKNIAVDHKIVVQSDDLLPNGESGLRIGDTWKRDDLVAYTLSVSSNDGARVLARTTGELLSLSSVAGKVTSKEAVSIFVAEMNTVAKDIGLSSLIFYNESGLDLDSQTNGGYGNATDVAKLFAKVYTSAPTVFENTVRDVSYIYSAGGINKTKNTNIIASSIPGLAASKTGFTDLALGNLGLVVEMGPGNPVVIVVLHSTKEGRFSDVERLRKATLEAMK